MKKTIMFLGVLSLGLAQAQQNDPYDGKVGINTETPSATLNVKSKTGTTASTKNFELQNASDKKLVTVLDDGKVGIGTETPKEKLHTNGNILAEVGGLISRISSPAGPYIELDNPSKTGSQIAKRWRIYNMTTGGYTNGLQFWPYDGTGPYFRGPAFIIGDNGNIGVRTFNPLESIDTSRAIKIGSVYQNNAISHNAKTPVPAGGSGTIVYQNGHFFGWINATNGWKQLDNVESTNTGATQLSGTDNIECKEENRGKMNFKKAEDGKSDVFGVCLKNANGNYNWAYFVGGGNPTNGSGAFGSGL